MAGSAVCGSGGEFGVGFDGGRVFDGSFTSAGLFGFGGFAGVGFGASGMVAWSAALLKRVLVASSVAGPSAGLKMRPRVRSRMLGWVERMSGQLPPRLKALLNLAITLALVLMSVPFLWRGLDGGSFDQLSLGLGLLLLGVFNLFT